MCHLRNHMETYCSGSFLKHIHIEKESNWSHHVLQRTMPPLDLLLPPSKTSCQEWAVSCWVVDQRGPMEPHTTQVLPRLWTVLHSWMAGPCCWRQHVIHFYLICIHVCLNTSCTYSAMPSVARKWHWISWDWSFRQFWPPLWVLGIEHTTSGRRASSVTVEPALLAHKLWGHKWP